MIGQLGQGNCAEQRRALCLNELFLKTRWIICLFLLPTCAFGPGIKIYNYAIYLLVALSFSEVDLTMRSVKLSLAVFVVCFSRGFARNFWSRRNHACESNSSLIKHSVY